MSKSFLGTREQYHAFNLRRFWATAARVLDDRQWAIIDMHYIAERSYADVAKTIGLSERHTRRIANEALDCVLHHYQQEEDA